MDVDSAALSASGRFSGLYHQKLDVTDSNRSLV